MEACKQKLTRFGVDPIFTGIVDPPFCPHGPTLLFQRYYSDKEERQFYACAVHRDRKGCSFFHWADEKITTEKRDRWKAVFSDQQLILESKILNVESFKLLSSSKQYFCPPCGLLLGKDDVSSHAEHGVRKDLSDPQLKEPTSLLCPIDDRKSQAQFLFSKTSLRFICNELKRLHYTRVLCVGTPSLHELLLKEGGIKSLLLDIDHRYIQFYTADQYQRYNMFNHFFYSPDGLSVCQKFLAETPNTVAIVVDPPFGGRAEFLAETLKRYWAMADKEVSTFLVFPYFLESHIVTASPSMWMMDYQVTYLNHKHFSAARKKPKPSPVRIFTNLSLPGFRLPREGYYLCKPCNRYVAKLNSHCKKCATCTSKDGQAYVHCDICMRCVKKSWVHCDVCKKCDLSQHSCGIGLKVGCHVCGSLGHKRKDCEEKTEQRELPRRKRKKKTLT